MVLNCVTPQERASCIEKFQQTAKVSYNFLLNNQIPILKYLEKQLEVHGFVQWGRQSKTRSSNVDRALLKVAQATVSLFRSEYMKYHIIEPWRKIWRHYCSSQLYALHNLSSCEAESWKKIETWTGFKPMSPVIPVQCYFFPGFNNWYCFTTA